MESGSERAGARGGTRRGFSIVEVLTALVVFASGTLVLAGAAAALARFTARSAAHSAAAAVALSRLEWIRTRPCHELRDSGTVTGGVEESWHIAGSSSTLVASLTVHHPRIASPKSFVLTVTC